MLNTRCLVANAQGWSLSAYPSGNVIYVTLEARPVESRHIKRLSRNEIGRLMRMLAAGDMASLEGEPWEAGYPQT